jgi:uncharacterized coiled-coil DUF342 family protein
MVTTQVWKYIAISRVHKKAKFRNLVSDWESFRRIRNEIIDMIREAKKQYIIKLQNSLIDKSIPPGKWWRIAKSVPGSFF